MTQCSQRSAQKPWLPLIAAFAAGGMISTGVVRAGQPNMENALSALQSARASLLAASPNKGGHRDRAIQLVDAAIHQVRAGIAFAAGN